jgi:hypothetical protein
MGSFKSRAAGERDPNAISAALPHTPTRTRRVQKLQFRNMRVPEILTLIFPEILAP